MKNNNNNKFLKIFGVIAFIGAFVFGLFRPAYIMADEVHQVNSWYSFNSTLTQDEDILENLNAQATYIFTFDPYGEGEVSSNTINNITYNAYSRTLYYSLAFYDKHLNVYESYDIVVYQDGSWVDDNMRYIFISSSLSHNMYEFLTDDGIWAYTYTLPQSTIGDLIYSVADIIPHTIQSLTSFQIFGFTLFAIFGTFALILLIIKLVRGVI